MQNPPSANREVLNAAKRARTAQDEEDAMDNTQNPQDVNTSHTSDGAARPNLMSRDEFVKRILHSGEVTRVGQHLALVIFLVAEGKNQLRFSVRELENITGWSRQTISDHLSELDVFMRVTFGGGRAKTLFELQGLIETAIASAVVSGSRRPRLTQRVVAKQPDASVVASQIDTRNFAASQIATRAVVASQVVAGLVASQLATTAVMASQPDAKIDTNPVVASQIDTTRLVASQIDATGLSRERERIYTSTNLSLSTTPRANEKAAAEEEDPIQVNGVAIKGPDFKLSYAGIDSAAALIGLPKERARAIAEIHARDWAMNGNKPDRPMAMITRLLKTDFNDGQVQEIKLEKAKAGISGVKQESSREQMRRLGEEELAKLKGGRRP